MLAEKKAQHNNSVIPVLMAGEFYNGFPPGHQAMMGADLRLPGIVAKLLNLQDDTDVLAWLKIYREETDRILLGEVAFDAAHVLAQHKQQTRCWSVWVLVHKAKFTIPQLRLLDGELAAHSRKIDEYCDHITNGGLADTPHAPFYFMPSDEAARAVCLVLHHEVRPENRC